MDFKINGEDLVGDNCHIGSDVEVEPGHILLIPSHDRFFHPKITPLDNSKVWPPWRRNAGSGFKACQGTSDYISLGVTWRLPAPAQFRPAMDGVNWEAQWGVINEGRETNRHGHDFPVLGHDNFSYEMSGEHCPFNKDRALPKSNQVKLVNPWIIKTAPGWSCLLLPNLMEPSRDWSLIPGVVNTDYYHTMNWVFNIYTDKEFVIPTGTPFAQVITFPRDHQNVEYGQSKLYPWLMDLGLGSFANMPSQEIRKGTYRKEQKEMPPAQVCPVAKTRKSFKQRFSDWLFGELNHPNHNTL